jgi:serpin B
VLTDALYLDAKWAVGFAAGQDQPGPFRTSADATTTATFMHGAGYRSATADGWTAVALPYRGGRLAMTALLPRPGPGAFGCRVPSPAALQAVRTALSGAGPAAGVALPKVSLGSHQDMNDLLTRLGMGIAFGRRADFTGLSPAACCISLVEHAATLRVGDTGTVGSAATGVGVAPVDAEMPVARQVVFARPYLMLVTGTASGEPLFLARVADPGG